MSNIDDTDDDLDDSSDLVKNLRKQLKEKDRLLSERETELSTFRSEKKAATVAEILAGKGINSKYAKFFTGEDSSPEAIESWVTENAELLGVDTSSSVDEQTQQAAAQISRASSSAPPNVIGTAAEAAAAIANAKTREELAAAYKMAGANAPS